MLIALASPAAAQVRLFTDGQIIKFGPTKAERRARQTGAMMGAMSGRRLDAGQPNASKGAAPPIQPSSQGIIRGVERAR
jgi:hypothetical protein